MWLTDWLYNTKEEQQRSDTLDAQLAALNKKQLDEGKYDEAWYEETQANLARGAVGDVSASVEDSFWEGWHDGEDNIRGSIGSVVGSPFKLIPWQVWLLAAVAIFFWLGGHLWLKRALERSGRWGK